MVMQRELEEHVLASVTSADLSPEVLSALYGVFHQNIVAALDIIDREAVTEITCPAGRKAYQVAGKGGRFYFLLLEENFCECAAYEYTVLRNEVSMCKHVLAARLAVAMGVVKQECITDTAFASRMCPRTPL
eukprot:m.84975 g.84975  ORF g.84975 m.84975 type:complete len:132 (-) comp14411_c1_seq4:173-568(-)